MIAGLEVREEVGEGVVGKWWARLSRWTCGRERQRTGWKRASGDGGDDGGVGG